MLLICLKEKQEGGLDLLYKGLGIVSAVVRNLMYKKVNTQFLS